MNKANNEAFQWKINLTKTLVNKPKKLYSVENYINFQIVSCLLTNFHFDIVFTKVRKTIGLLRKLISVSTRAALVANLKVFVRPHLDYGDACMIRLLIQDQVFDQEQAYSLQFKKFEYLHFSFC